jgi:hypothetical protein
MIIKNTCGRAVKARRAIFHINPIIKSTVIDYCTPAFIQEAVLSIALFVVMAVEFIKTTNPLNQMEYSPVIFIGLLAALSVAFMGIVDCIPHTNWAFYAIVSGNNFTFHAKRTIVFLATFFGLLLTTFIILVLCFEPKSIIKYLYATVAVLLFSINTSFVTGSMFLKAVAMIVFTILTLYLVNLNNALWLLSIIPVLVSFIKSRTEYCRWYII